MSEVAPPRKHRTLEEWQQIQKEMTASPEPTPPEGYMQVKVDGVYHTAPTVETLKAQGYKVIINHKRYRKSMPKSFRRLGYRGEIKAKGGVTHVFLLQPEHGGWSEGRAVCVARDCFSRKVGYVLAVNKALGS
jgi:hypothetical protein